MVATQNKYYGNVNPSNGQDTDQSTSLTTSSSNHAPNAFPTKLAINPPKGIIHKYTFNPHARATQKYNIVEDLAWSPSSTSTLEVLKNFPT